MLPCWASSPAWRRRWPCRWQQPPRPAGACPWACGQYSPVWAWFAGSCMPCAARPLVTGRACRPARAARRPARLFLAAMMGILLAPTLVVLWVIVLGLGTGASFVVALSLIAMRANDLTTASRLSSMAQAIGYAIAALGLFLAGLVQGWNTL